MFELGERSLVGPAVLLSLAAHALLAWIVPRRDTVPIPAPVAQGRTTVQLRQTVAKPPLPAPPPKPEPKPVEKFVAAKPLPTPIPRSEPQRPVDAARQEVARLFKPATPTTPTQRPVLAHARVVPAAAPSIERVQIETPPISAPPTQVSPPRRTPAPIELAASQVADIPEPPQLESAAGDVDVPPTIVSNPKPAYPAEARAARQTGTVILLVRVGVNGRAAAARVHRSSGVAALDASARSTVLTRWVFEPARRGDETVAHDVYVPVRFRIQDR